MHVNAATATAAPEWFIMLWLKNQHATFLCECVYMHIMLVILEYPPQKKACKQLILFSKTWMEAYPSFEKGA